MGHIHVFSCFWTCCWKVFLHFYFVVLQHLNPSLKNWPGVTWFWDPLLFIFSRQYTASDLLGRELHKWQTSVWSCICASGTCEKPSPPNLPLLPVHGAGKVGDRWYTFQSCNSGWFNCVFCDLFENWSFNSSQLFYVYNPLWASVAK